jgi:hypothetical protein
MTRDDLIREIDRLSQKIALNSAYGPMSTGVFYAPYIPENFKAMPQSKYQFSRKWYIADISDADYHNVRAWCKEQFGPEDTFPNAWSRWQHRYEHQIHLRDEQDYILFVLKWGA